MFVRQVQHLLHALSPFCSTGCRRFQSLGRVWNESPTAHLAAGPAEAPEKQNCCPYKRRLSVRGPGTARIFGAPQAAAAYSMPSRLSRPHGFFRAAVTLLVEDDRGHDFLQLLRAKYSSRHLNRQGEYQFEASETSIKSVYPASDAHRTSCQTALVVVRFCPNERCGSFKVSAD